ncbi:CASP-like protein 4A3 [Iris pallida]|uniref:CASP-like protein n=1 Tax=Iris pallida TaxID=29817 RepID=A0AAX6FD36_IRIPA|nr:CASP-like protein 4A3 [Iris pallida]
MQNPNPSPMHFQDSPMESSPYRSPLSQIEHPTPSPAKLPPPRPASFPAQTQTPAAVTAAAAAKTDRGGSRSATWTLRKDRASASVGKLAVGVRLAAATLCLISFSVMAADKRKGWALDSYDQYNEYRYCLSVNVIGFVYATFQAYAEVHHMTSKKHIIGRPMGYYFDFAMDQILAYLLISASSSVTARTDYWVSNWGVDPFTNMISGSVAMSFLAFIAFAVSSLISAYTLFSTQNH